jgi:hypothetical protein
VYNLREPLKLQVDRLLLTFTRSHTFAPSDFTLNANGVCRLHPQLAMSDIVADDIASSWLATEPGQ